MVALQKAQPLLPQSHCGIVKKCAPAIYSLYSLHVSAPFHAGDLLLPGGGAEESGGGTWGATATYTPQPHLAG